MPGFNIAGGDHSDQISSTLADVKGKDAYRVHRWRILSLPGVDAGDRMKLSKLILYAKSLTPPTFSVAEESVDSGVVKYKFAGQAEWEDVSITFYDVYGLYEELVKIRNKIWNPESGIGFPGSYKTDSEYILYDHIGEEVQKITLKNAWVKNISHSELSYEDSSFKEVTLTISYDWAVEEFTPPKDHGELIEEARGTRLPFTAFTETPEDYSTKMKGKAPPPPRPPLAVDKYLPGVGAPKGKRRSDFEPKKDNDKGRGKPASKKNPNAIRRGSLFSRP